MQRSERLITGALLVAALLTFFLPLASLQLPILGSQEVTGYDLVIKANHLSQTLDTIKPKELDSSSTEDSQTPSIAPDNSQARTAMPLSVQTIPLIAIEIFVSFAVALLAFFSCFGQFSSSPAKYLCTTGGLTALAGIIHLTVANSDLHSFFNDQIRASSSAQDSNPFNALTQQIAGLAANSVQLKPGAGLYALAVCLSVAAILLHSRLLSASTQPERALIDRDEDEGNTQSRIIIFIVLFIFVGAVAAFVLFHKETPTRLEKGEFDGEFTPAKALTALFGNYDPLHKSSRVTITDGNGGTSANKLTLLLDSIFTQGGEQKHLLVTSTAESDSECHACDAEVGAYVFKRTKRGWIPEIEDAEIGRSGAWGLAGKARAIRFAPGAYGFALTLEDGGQGEEDTSQLFIAPLKGHFQAVLALTIEADNEGACGSTDQQDLVSSAPCYRNNSTIQFLKSTHNGFFDIQVDESGTTSTDETVTPSSGRKIYLFSGEKYMSGSGGGM